MGDKQKRIEQDFQRHWTQNNLDQVPEGKLVEAGKFFLPAMGDLHKTNCRVLDVGCGDGVHWRFLRSMETLNLKYSGLDISPIIIDRLTSLAGPADNFITCSGESIPVGDSSYDVAFTYGVLSYVDNPRTSFAELCRVTRPGGIIGVWVAKKPGMVGSAAFRLVRAICTLGGGVVSRLVSDLIVLTLSLIPTKSGISLRNASWAACREVVLVNLAPKHLVLFSPEEVQDWFRDEGILIEHEDDQMPISIWGRKPVDHLG